jgi:hypothetical protein
MIEAARRIETTHQDVASTPPEALDDRSMRILEWALSAVALIAALALALLR